MDFETIFTLLLLALYLLFQFAGRKKKPTRGPAKQRLPRPADTGGELTLEEALREIRIALGDEAPPAPQPRAEAPKPASKSPLPMESPALFEERFEKRPGSSEFHPASTRYDEERLEARPTLQPVAVSNRAAPPALAPAKAPITANSIVGSAVEVHRASSQGDSEVMEHLRETLQRPRAARTAFLLGEILGAPRSKRSPRS